MRSRLVLHPRRLRVEVHNHDVALRLEPVCERRAVDTCPTDHHVVTKPVARYPPAGSVPNQSPDSSSDDGGGKDQCDDERPVRLVADPDRLPGPSRA